MSGSEVVATVLMAAAVALQLVACLGVAAMRDCFDRLHYAGVAGCPALLLAAALLAEEGFSLIANKALLLAAFMLATSPVLAHVTARAARVRARGDAALGDDEAVEVVRR